MLSRAKPVLLGLCVAAGFVAHAMAQQNLSCDAFGKNMEGDWVAKQDMMIPGPTGPVQVKAGQPVDDAMQKRLDAQCGD
jgi:hypothetical protein